MDNQETKLRSDESTERARQKYEKSDLGKAKNKRWNLSEKGKASRKKYLESELGQAALLRYYHSEKAETSRQKRRALERLFSLVKKYLNAHPESTMGEALEEITKEKEHGSK